MNFQSAFVVAFGFWAFPLAEAQAVPASGAVPFEPASVILAQAKAKDDDDDENGRPSRGRRGGEEKSKTFAPGGKSKGSEAEDRKSSDPQPKQTQQPEPKEFRQPPQAGERKSFDHQPKQTQQPEPKESQQPPQAGERKSFDRQPKQTQQPEPKESQQLPQAGQPKEFPRPEQTEQQKQLQQPKPFQAEPRDARRDRTGRADRDEWRDRLKRLETEKTSAQELSRIKVEAGKPTVIDGGAREFRREGDRIVIRSDDQRRIRSDRDRHRVERLQGGQTRTIIIRPDGTQIITIIDSRGSIVRRVRRDRGGREIILIAAPQRPPLVQLDLGPLRIGVPRERYFIDSRRASRRDIEMILRAPPVERVQRPYMLEEIRQFDRLRDMMPRVNVSSITFETDSALISEDQIASLQDLADVMLDIIDENPAETFMLAGHTDATGAREYNLALSERRAEAVAIALSDYFGVPAENLVTQGYGPDQLLINTAGPERENRRVEVIRLTPLLAGR